MTISRIAAGTSAGAIALALVLASPAAAGAHVTLEGTSAAPGTTSTLSFTIEHGCDASPTTAVRIAIPDEVSAVTPLANPGWDIDLDLVGEGRSMTYEAQTPLPSPVHGTIDLDVSLPDDLADGTVLAFPVEQTCETGSLSWASVDADADAPAPTLVVAVPVAEEAAVATDAPVGGPIAIAALVAAVGAAALATIALRRQQARR